MEINKEIIIKDYNWLIELVFELISSGDIEIEKYALDELPDRFVRDISEMLKLKDIATNLLSKLNTLDRKSIEKSLIDYGSEAMTEYTYGKRTGKEVLKKYINQIMQLIPEQGKVLFEGQIKCLKTENNLNPEAYIDGKSINKYFKKYDSKEIIIKVEVVK